MQSLKLAFQFLLFPVMLFALFTGCRKDSLKGELVEGQIALTFDDNSIDNWFKYMPLLDSLNIKATFYISGYQDLSKIQKNKLHTIAHHGHEIAYHTTSHPNMVTMVEKNGIVKTLEQEIDTGLTLMRQDGFEITNFAYPYGRHNQTLDVGLKRYFKSIRAVSNKQNYSKSLVKKSGERQLYYGADIDECSRLGDDVLFNLLSQAQVYHDCLVLVAHKINTPNYKFQVTADRLRKLAVEADKRNLQFITIKDIGL